MEEKKSNENIARSFVNLQGWMISDLGLAGDELIVYAIIFGFTQDGQSECWSSLAYFEKWTGKGRDAIIRAIEDLATKKLIFKRRREGATSALRVNLDFVNPSQNTTGVVAKCDGTRRKMRPNNKKIINIYNSAAAAPEKAAGVAQPQTTPDSPIANGSGYGLVEQPDRPQADERHVQWCRARALDHETRSFEEWLSGTGEV